jgi:hypothetical protein
VKEMMREWCARKQRVLIANAEAGNWNTSSDYGILDEASCPNHCGRALWPASTVSDHSTDSRIP